MIHAKLMNLYYGGYCNIVTVVDLSAVEDCEGGGGGEEGEEEEEGVARHGAAPRHHHLPLLPWVKEGGQLLTLGEEGCQQTHGGGGGAGEQGGEQGDEGGEHRHHLPARAEGHTRHRKVEVHSSFLSAVKLGPRFLFDNLKIFFYDCVMIILFYLYLSNFRNR